eukprot:TRINITY_DN1870_c0_g1_i1.p1 TRINITY_DN1870_c0_g1~~TRINITY_DN1870_c0_g1_i1.p1  ORF type:complete len:459 (-),score=161.72 TRINITY_DN1870_c0_g1_i1:97-1473(-)
MSSSSTSASSSSASSSVSSKQELKMATTVEEKVQLITRNLQEVMGDKAAIDKMTEILKKRDLKLYWGTATTGQPHIAYCVPLSKLSDFLRAGCHVTILFADLHAFLDNMKTEWDLLEARTKYYEAIIKAVLESIGVPLDRLHFVRGTEYQLSKEFTLDMYRMSSMTRADRAKHAGAEVVKQEKSMSPLMSCLLYPLLQALDEVHLHVDCQFGGVDQRKIFALAEEQLPKLGYEKRLHIMNPMIPSLLGGQGNKMSASISGSKIDFLESEESVNKKIRGAYCPEGVIEGNGLLAFVKMVIFPLSPNGFTITRDQKFGGDIFYKSYDDLEKAFLSKALFPLDLKTGVAAFVNRLIEPIRKKFAADPKLMEIVKLAYPEEKEEKKVAAKKEKKDKQTDKPKDKEEETKKEADDKKEKKEKAQQQQQQHKKKEKVKQQQPKKKEETKPVQTVPVVEKKEPTC